MAGLREVVATRYVTPLREGGSLPGLVEADDLGTYVVKWTGAGQGPRALVAEVIAGELGRELGLPVPELVVLHLDARMANAEPDEEVQDLLRASPGPNLGMDYLPGAIGIERPDGLDPDLAADVVVFDALIQNVDRSWRNPNLLRWHGRPWLIDHGAALWWQHNWPRAGSAASRPFPMPESHLLLGIAGSLTAAAARLLPRVSADLLAAVTARVPDAWLTPGPGSATAPEPGVPATPAEIRAAHAAILSARAADPTAWLTPLEAARG